MKPPRFSFLLPLIVLFCIGCGKPQIDQLEEDSIVVAFGDSLTSGVGAKEEETYPSVLAELLGQEVINAGISGEDTTAGLRRLEAMLTEHQPDLVILCFGGNDMLRKQSSTQTIANLKTMIETIQDKRSDVIMIGVPKPGLLLSVPEFYEDLAEEYDLAYEGAILKKVLSNSSLKSDHIHPNQRGYRMIAERVHQLIQKSEK